MKKQKIALKSPIKYHGGKSQLASRIISLIPKHTTYVEAFCGGASIFFAKKPSSVEIINDSNQLLINFYRVIKEDFALLMKELRTTLHSRHLHTHAKVITEYPELFSPIKRAWAVFVRATQGFNGILTSQWGYDIRSSASTRTVRNKVLSLTEEYSTRLQHTQLESTDALRVIRSRNYADSFIYCDPPYFNSECRYHNGYTKDDFERLLSTLASVEGTFLLSSYPSPLLSRYTKENGWYTIEIEMGVGASKKGKRKVEVLTANYPIKLDT